jgi:hypothetical protein
MVMDYDAQACRDALSVLKGSPPRAQVWAALSLVKYLSSSEAVLGVAARHHLQRVVDPLQVAFDFMVYEKQLQEEAELEETT